MDYIIIKTVYVGNVGTRFILKTVIESNVSHESAFKVSKK